jgi:SHS2 domain-containing protein
LTANQKNYQLIEHTADIGIRVKGRDLKELFKNAAEAMFDIIAEPKSCVKTKPKIIELEQKADTLEELFINWLNELLSLSDAKKLIFSKFAIQKIDSHILKVRLSGNQTKNCTIKSEIKAATYHQLKLIKTPSFWQAEVIFDV